MTDSKQEIERKQRLHEWFKSEPEIWNDIVEEIRISHKNEENQLKARTCIERNWSAGYVSGQEYILDMERYYKKVWTPAILQNKT